MKKINWVKMVVAIVVTQAAGGIGALFTAPKTGSDWYLTLNKPFFQPPGWLFGPVWTLLFILMGIALYLVWNKKKDLTSKIYHWFWIQLVLNVIWSVIFFGLESPGWAAVEILGLWWAIKRTINSFSAVNKTAGQLLIPYLAWVSFATLLTATVWMLNR